MNKDELIMEGMLKIADNSYKVKIDLIVEERSTEEQENLELKFSNPRYLSETFDEKAIGCSAAEMESLKLSIQEHGLLTPLIGRKNGDKVSLINGHRRYHAIKELIAANILCYDPCSKKNIPAKELYDTVDIKVFDSVNDMECYVLAFAEDKSKVKFGAGIEYKFVQHCIQNKISDDKIVRMTGNNQKWLDGVKSLLKKLEGEYEILDALFSNRMNISAAKKIAEVEDPQQRMAIFKEASVVADEETVQKKEKQRKSIIATRKKIENALADKATASFSGNPTAEQEADDIIESYRKQEEEQQDALKNIETRITGRNVAAVRPKPQKQSDKTRKEEEVKVVPMEAAQLNMTSLLENWIHPLDSMMDDKDLESNKIVIEFAKDLLESVMDTSSSCSEFMNKWFSKFEGQGLVG